jgi:hypothetical protein
LSQWTAQHGRQTDGKESTEPLAMHNARNSGTRRKRKNWRNRI